MSPRTTVKNKIGLDALPKDFETTTNKITAKM